MSYLFWKLLVLVELNPEEFPDGFKEIAEDLELVETDLRYDIRIPTDIWIYRSKSTGKFYEISNYHDSWYGADWNPTISEVVEKEVLVKQYVGHKLVVIDFPESDEELEDLDE